MIPSINILIALWGAVDILTADIPPLFVPGVQFTRVMTSAMAAAEDKVKAGLDSGYLFVCLCLSSSFFRLTN